MSKLTKSEIIVKIKELKPVYEKDGIILLGLFGSYARGEEKEDSDIDILYDIDLRTFLSKYPGFRAFSRLTDMKEELKNIFHKSVDIADKSTLNTDTKQYILKDLIYAK